MPRVLLGVGALAVVVAAAVGLWRPWAEDPEVELRDEVVGYYMSWSVYARDFLVGDLVASGAAEDLTVINYAFGNVAPEEADWDADAQAYVEPDDDPGDIVCQVGDPWADYQMSIDADRSVTGEEISEIEGHDLLGSFHEIKALKERYPDLRAMISLGGWSWSKYFSDAAATEESRQALVESCIDLFLRGDLPEEWTGGPGGQGVGEGVFDGIDLDWEWPGSEGHEHNVIREEDKENFTKLVQEFRDQLDDLEAETGEAYELTAFVPADPEKIDLGYEVEELVGLLDFVTVQGYDLYGAWDLDATNHHSQLHAPEGDPDPERFSAAGAVEAWKERGAPPEWLVLGVPFYGRGWTSVEDADDGRYQPAEAPAPGMWEDGVEDYHRLVELPDEGFQRHWDDEAKVPWLWDGETFWSYEDVESLGHKTDYVVEHDLSGVMFWELSGDTEDAELVEAIAAGLAERRDRQE